MCDRSFTIYLIREAMRWFRQMAAYPKGAGATPKGVNNRRRIFGLAELRRPKQNPAELNIANRTSTATAPLKHARCSGGFPLPM